jgi:hypothetical protein
MPTNVSNSTARARLSLAHIEVDQQRLHDLEPDVEHRVERSHRLLEDHCDVAAAHLAHLVFREVEQVAALEQDAAGDHAPGGLRKQAHDGERRNRLAAARLADQRNDFAGLDPVGHPLHRAHHALRGDEMDVQVLDFEQPGA